MAINHVPNWTGQVVPSLKSSRLFSFWMSSEGPSSGDRAAALEAKLCHSLYSLANVENCFESAERLVLKKNTCFSAWARDE